MLAHYQWRHYVDLYLSLYFRSIRDPIYLSPYVQKVGYIHLSRDLWIVSNRNTICHWNSCWYHSGASWKPWRWSSLFEDVGRTSCQWFKAFCSASWDPLDIHYIYFRTSYTVSQLQPYFPCVFPVHPLWAYGWSAFRNSLQHYATYTLAQ